MLLKTMLIGFLMMSQTQVAVPYVKNEPVVMATTDASTSFRIDIVPNNGWYWNEKYPSKFKLNDEESLKNTKLDVVVEAWVVEATKTFVKVSVVGSQPGTTDIMIKGKFSLCSPTTCQVFTDKFKVRIIIQNEKK